MRNPTPRVESRYGAPMGRGWPHMTPEMAETVRDMYVNNPPRDANESRHLAVARGMLTPQESPKVSLRRIPLDSQGYDSGGAYWGHGAPLYCAQSDCGTVDMWFRARTRDAAKAIVREQYSNVRFYR